MRRLLSLLLMFVMGCTRFDVLNALVTKRGYHRTADIAYGPLPRQRLDVYQPDHQRPKAPIVIFFYGGYWLFGDRGDYRFVGETLTSQGFVAVLPDYRVYPQTIFPGFVKDGALAIRWVHDNADRLGGDPDRIYLMGHSAGAHIAAMLTLDPEYLQEVGLNRSVIRATAGLSGPYDFDLDHYDRPAFGKKPNDTTPMPQMEPINFVDGHAPPMLLLQGLEDDTVNPNNAVLLASRIHQAGGDVTMISYPKLGHEGVVLALAKPFHWLGPVLKDTVDFFNTHIPKRG